MDQWLVNGLFHLLINGVYWGYNPLILTIDPNFLQHPSMLQQWCTFLFSLDVDPGILHGIFQFSYWGHHEKFGVSGGNGQTRTMARSESFSVGVGTYETPKLLGRCGWCFAPPRKRQLPKPAKMKPKSVFSSWFVALIEGFDSILGCDAKIRWECPDSPWRIEAVAASVYLMAPCSKFQAHCSSSRSLRTRNETKNGTGQIQELRGLR